MSPDMDKNGFPNHVLNYPINSTIKIYISFIIPLVLQLLVYMFQICSDIGVAIQYFSIKEYHYGLITILLIISPPFIAFWILVLSADLGLKVQANKAKYICNQVLLLFTFPFSMTFSYCYRLFWSIEALYKVGDEQQQCLQKCIEGCSSEIYNFIKAYFQSAPQIILLLNYMMNETLFRNFETTHIQAMSLVFSTIDLTIITLTYQRYESQKIAGRPYPWASSAKHMEMRNKLENSEKIQEQMSIQKEHNKRISEKTISQFPENDAIYEKFLKPGSQYSSSEDGYDEVDGNITDEQKLRDRRIVVDSSYMDQSPSIPAPSRPTTTTQTSVISSQNGSTTPGNLLHRFSTFKDMLVVNTELYIQNHVPRPPSFLTKHINSDANVDEQEQSINPRNAAPADEVDFFLPYKHKTVDGAIQQDDFAGKTVAFFGWLCFIVMRILVLSTFAYFYLKPFIYIVLGHYFLSLVVLLWTCKFREKKIRILFYFVLAYIYIFVILEFKIKFKKIKLIYIGYFILTMTENVTMTYIWYNHCDFESWWFDFIYKCILYGGVLFICSLIVYYCILKPREIIIYQKVDEDGNIIE